MDGLMDFTDELLGGGKTLVYIKHRFLSKRTREQLDWLFACIRDSELLIPALPVSGKPDLLEAEDGTRYLPVFSQEEQMPPDYISEFDILPKTFDKCFELARSIDGVVGIELDAFSEPFTITFDMAEAILSKPSRRHE